MLCVYVCAFFSSCCKGMVTAMALSIAGSLQKNPAKELHDLDQMKVRALFSLFVLFVLNGLFRFNWFTIDYTNLKGTIWSFLKCAHTCKVITTIKKEHMQHISLYILVTSLLLIMWFTNIFSVCDLSFLLNNIFQERKVLILMFNLFFFLFINFWVLYLRKFLNNNIMKIFSYKYYSFRLYIQVCDPFWVNFFHAWCQVWDEIHFLAFGYPVV